MLAASCIASKPVVLPKPPGENPDFVQRGGVLFIDRRISGDGSRSCAGCHAPQSKGRLLYENGEQVQPGTPGGRIAPALRGLFDRKALFWDGSVGSLDAALDRMLQVEMRGAVLAPPDRAALLAYLRSLPVFDNGRILPDGTPTEPSTISQRNGQETFVMHCGSCHPVPAFRSPMPADIGTGGAFPSPTLRGLPREGPYGRDGRWPTIEAAVQAILENRKIELNFRQRLELTEYLKIL